MSDVTFALALVVDTVASGFIGWLLGRTARNTALVAAEVVEDPAEGDADGPESEARRNRARERLARVRTPHVVMALLLVVGAVTAVQGFSVATQQSNLVTCVARYSDDLADALDSRAAPNQGVQLAQDKIWTAVDAAFADPAGDPKGARIAQAIAGYNKLRAEQRQSQAAHPLPDPPRGACAALLR